MNASGKGLFDSATTPGTHSSRNHHRGQLHLMSMDNVGTPPTLSHLTLTVAMKTAVMPPSKRHGN